MKVVELQKIKDNGKSFDVAQQLSAGGKRRLGLVGMQERVRLVNGRFAVKSAPGKGTTVSLSIPHRPGVKPSLAATRRSGVPGN